MKAVRQKVLAWEVADGAWEVLECDSDLDDGEGKAKGRVIGFIEKSRGFYEIESISGRPRQAYCASFQEAVDLFEIEGLE